MPLLTKLLRQLDYFPDDQAIELPYDWSTLRKKLQTSSDTETELCFKALGFKVFYSTEEPKEGEPLFISILSQEQGSNTSIAQTLAEKSKQDLREEIARQKDIAICLWNCVAERLEEDLQAGKLQTSKEINGTFTITVNVATPLEKGSQYYDAYHNALNELASKNGFHNIHVKSDKKVLLIVKNHAEDTAEEPKPAEADEAESAD